MKKQFLKQYYEQLKSNKVENLHEVHKFFEIPKVPKLIQREIENFNKSETSEEIQTVFQNCQEKARNRRFHW